MNEVPVALTEAPSRSLRIRNSSALVLVATTVALGLLASGGTAFLANIGTGAGGQAGTHRELAAGGALRGPQSQGGPVVVNQVVGGLQAPGTSGTAPASQGGANGSVGQNPTSSPPVTLPTPTPTPTSPALPPLPAVPDAPTPTPTPPGLPPGLLGQLRTLLPLPAPVASVVATLTAGH